MSYYTVVFKHPLTCYCEADTDPVTSFEEAVERAKEKVENFMLNAAGRLVISSEIVDMSAEVYKISFSFTNGKETGAEVSVQLLEYSKGSNALGDGATGLLGI